VEILYDLVTVIREYADKCCYSQPMESDKLAVNQQQVTERLGRRLYVLIGKPGNLPSAGTGRNSGSRGLDRTKSGCLQFFLLKNANGGLGYHALSASYAGRSFYVLFFCSTCDPGNKLQEENTL